jgi:hypothetical protein
VLAGGTRGVEDDHARAGAERRVQVVQQPERLLDLVVHVDHEHRVGRRRGEARVVRLAQRQHHVGLRALAQAPPEQAEVARLDVWA